MREREPDTDPLKERQALLPEIVKLYVRHGEILADPLMPELDRMRYRAERLEMFKVMKPEEVAQLIGYSEFITQLTIPNKIRKVK